MQIEKQLSPYLMSTTQRTPATILEYPSRLFMNIKSIMVGLKEPTQQKIYLKINLKFLVSVSI